MKIFFLAPANSIHTIKWINSLSKQGLEIHLISTHNINASNSAINKQVKIHILKYKAPLGYILNFFQIRKLLKKIKPDIVNAHYATGYGLLARLAGFRPLLLSVWGSDVYQFPEKSFLHKFFLKSNLKFATAVTSTSECMAKQMQKTYKHKNVFITPFGIDETKFLSKDIKNDDNIIRIGIAKSLSHVYAIDILLEAFALIVNSTDKQVYLDIAGEGSEKENLENLAKKLGIAERVNFVGYLKNQDVPNFLNNLDIFVNLSRSESFGVSVLEAMACELPVVVSSADGLKEIVEQDKTGLIVEIEDIQATANAILHLINDKAKRLTLGKLGRARVLEKYTWTKSIEIMLNAYNKIIHKEFL